MLSNHFDLDQAIEELRSTQPSLDRRVRSVDAVLKPRTKGWAIPRLAAAAFLSAMCLLFVPTRGNSLPWTDVLRRTQRAKNMHIMSMDDRGQIVGEQWRSGAKWASWAKDRSGRILFDNRSDQDHFYTYLYRKELTAPNAVQYATLWNKTPQMTEGENRFTGPVQTI